MPRDKMVLALIRYGGACYRELSVKRDHEIEAMVDSLKKKVVVGTVTPEDEEAFQRRRRGRRPYDEDDEEGMVE